MAENNYISPSGMQPKVGWTPEGFLGGYLYADQERDYKNALNISNTSSLMGMQKQGNELQDYALNALVREAERKANIAKSQATEQYAVPQAGANLEQVLSSTAANRATTAGTLIDNETRGKRNIAELDKTTLENRGRQLEQAMSVLSIAQHGGPAAMPYAMQEAKKIGMPEALVQQMFDDPQKFAEKIAKTKQSYIEKMAERELQNKGMKEAASARPAPTNYRMFMLDSITEDLLRTGQATTREEAKAMASRIVMQESKPLDASQGAGEKTEQTEAAKDAALLRTRIATMVARGEDEEGKKIKSLKAHLQVLDAKAKPVVSRPTLPQGITKGGEAYIDLTGKK